MREAVKKHPTLSLDGAVNGFVLPSAPGMLVEVDDPDPELDFSLDMDVSAISVFIPNIDSAKVVKGLWRTNPMRFRFGIDR